MRPKERLKSNGIDQFRKCALSSKVKETKRTATKASNAFQVNWVCVNHFISFAWCDGACAFKASEIMGACACVRATNKSQAGTSGIDHGKSFLPIVLPTQSHIKNLSERSEMEMSNPHIEQQMWRSIIITIIIFILLLFSAKPKSERRRRRRSRKYQHKIVCVCV